MSGKSIYRKLTGRRRSIAGYSQLWLAPDHLLMLESSRFVERYRRFALSDIQAIVVTGSPSRTPWQIAALAVSIAWTLALFTVDSLFLKVVIGVSGAILVAISIADIALGERCRCFLETGVSRELLAPVARVRAASRFLAEVRPAIEAVQGSIAPEQIAAAAGIETFDAAAPPPVAQKPSHLPEVLFGLFLVNGLLIGAAQYRAAEIASVLPSTLFGEFLIVIVALIRRAGRDPRRVIYVLMLAALVFMGHDAFEMLRGFGGFMGAMIEQSQHGRAVTVPFDNWLRLSRDNTIFAVVWRAVAGIGGLMAARMERAESMEIVP